MPTATATAPRSPEHTTRRRPPPPVNGIPGAVTGHDRDSYITSTAMLADLLQPHIDALNLQLACGDERITKRGAGAIQAVSDRAAAMLGVTPHSTVRRLHGIRAGQSRATTCELADGLLDAFDLMIEHTNLPTFPGGIDSALEMVDIYHENHPEPLSELERRALARDLLSFTLGFLADNSPDPLPEIEEWTRLIARTRLRRSQQPAFATPASRETKLAA